MIFVSGLGAPETPRLREDGSWMCVEMAPHRGGVTHISADGAQIRLVAKTGTPNGLTIDRGGVAWVAETHPHPSLLRVTLEGSVDLILDASPDVGPFLLPNDLCFGPDGALYMTDSGMLMTDWVQGGSVRPDWQTAEFDGRIYRIELAARRCDCLDRGLRFVNGIAFSPDGDLYVNEMITGNVYRYRGSSGQRELFGNVLTEEWMGGFRGPDGMAFAADGRLYCTVYGQGDVTVLGPDGSVLERIATQGRNPTNVAFGPDGERRIYVTEHEFGQMEMFDVDTAGLPLMRG